MNPFHAELAAKYVQAERMHEAEMARLHRALRKARRKKSAFKDIFAIFSNMITWQPAERRTENYKGSYQY